MDAVTVTSDSLTSPHQITAPLQLDVEDHAHTYVQLSHPPTISSRNFHVDLVVSPSCCNMNFVPQPSSSHSVVPLDDIVLCSSIPDSTLVMNEEQATEKVGVAQRTCAVIHEEYEWELEHQNLAKDDSIPFEPPPFFLDIFGEAPIHDSTCVSSSTNAPIFYHSPNTLDVIPSFDNGEDKLFIENSLDLSFAFSGNAEGRFVHISSTPLFDSSDHEAHEINAFSYRGGCDPFTPILDHDHDPMTVDFSKPPVYHDLSVDEVETPKIVEALFPELMAILGPCSFGVSFTFDHEIFQSPEAPHHSYVCIEDQSHTQIILPLLELHDPITHALEESYIASMHE